MTVFTYVSTGVGIGAWVVRINSINMIGTFHSELDRLLF